MRKLAFLVLPIVLAVTASVAQTSPEFEESECACITLPSLAEVARLTAIAEDEKNPEALSATGEVYFAYLQRGDKKQAEIWKARAIAVGEPRILNWVADSIMVAVSDERDPRKQITMLGQAIELFTKAEPRRDKLSDLDRRVYVDEFRAAQGTLAILRDGIEPWIAKANSGDATAAHHVAAYYFYGHLDQDRRAAWEDRAARLGDPGFAWSFACCWRETRSDLLEGKRVIQIAKANRNAWAGAGDEWTQRVLAKDLDDAESQIDNRLGKLHR